MIDPATCGHEHFEADADVTRILNGQEEAEGGSVVAFVVEMRVRCADCHAQFGWRGVPAGITVNGHPTRSADGLTLNAWLMSPSEIALLDGLPGMVGP